MRITRPSTGTVLGGLALFVALGGTAAAATGQIVNIADPTNAGNIAKVDSGGALKVKGYPNTAMFSHIAEGNFYADGSNQTIVFETTATLAIDRIQLSIYDPGGASPWDGAFWYRSADSNGVCNGNPTRLEVDDLQPSTTHLDEFPSPLILKPAVAGGKWCLMAGFGPVDASTDGAATFGVSGVVLAGTFSPAISAPPAKKTLTRPLPTQLPPR